MSRYTGPKVKIIPRLGVLKNISTKIPKKKYLINVPSISKSFRISYRTSKIKICLVIPDQN